MNNVFCNFIGIDVSKDSLDIFCISSSVHKKISNSNKAIKKFFSEIDPKNTFIVLENTGGYEKRCINILLDLGYTLHRTNNNQVKNYMKSFSKKGKTDRIDAIALARYGQERHKELEIYKLPSKEEESIRQMAKYLSDLKIRRAEEKNRLKSPGCDSIYDRIRMTISFLNDQIKEIEKNIDELINKSEEMKRKVSLLCQYKGVGKTTAIQLIAHLPELGNAKKQSIAALAGVAPYANDSGSKSGYRTTKGGGRSLVKKALFLVALSAIRFNDEISTFFQMKREQGKRKMVAITACMRKIIVCLNAILRDGYISTTIN